MKITHNNYYRLKIHHPHRCREQTGEVYFPSFPGCRDDCFLHMLLHWIHILFNPMFSCHSHKQAEELMNVKAMSLHQSIRSKKMSAGRTDRLPKRAFIFCLSSRVMRTHASDRVSFTICRRKSRRRQERRKEERYCQK